MTSHSSGPVPEATRADILLHRAEVVALRLSISRAAVYRLIANGTLPSVLVGGARRVSERQLVDYVAGLEAGVR